MSKTPASRRLETLSKRQRLATPLPFAEYLLSRVRELFGVQRVACLWVAEGSVYNDLDCDCWPLSRDAMKFDGTGPIIAHPPCGPWGNYKAKCFRQGVEHGVRAMEYVHRFGGVVEQPSGSRLFRDYGAWFGQDVEKVNQSDYGHLALKPTLLYWVRQASQVIAHSSHRERTHDEDETQATHANQAEGSPRPASR